MNFEFSEEQDALRDAVRRFLDDRAPLAHTRAQWDDPAGTTPAAWSGLAALGVTGLLVPDSAGGAGGGMVDAAVVCEELGRVASPAPYVASAVGAAGLLADLDPDHPRLSGIADGTTVATVALLEPGRRADWRAPDTLAARVDDGWILTGVKAHVPDLVAAHVALVTATSPDGLRVFAVDPTDDRVACEPTPTVDGTRREGRLTLDRAPAVPVGRTTATAAIATTIDRVHTAWVVDGVGAAERAMTMAIEYAKERQQFGVAIGSFQAVQHLCADMLRNVELARVAAYYACWTLDAADPAEAHRAVTMALACAADGLYAVGAATIQVHGGIGYTWEHDAHLLYKRLLTLQGLGGGVADHLEELATLVLDS